MASGRPGGGGVSKTASSTHSHKPVAVIGAGSIIALAVCESGSIRLVIKYAAGKVCWEGSRPRLEKGGGTQCVLF